VTFNPLIVCGVCDRCRAGRTSLCRRRKLIGAHRPGAFARFVEVPAAQCYALPEGLSDVAGSLTEPLACGVRAVGLAGLASDEPLLILGAGPIGLCCLVAARAAGVRRVLISDVKRERLAVAERWGAEQAIDVGRADLAEQVRASYPDGVAAAIDAVGAAATRAQAVASVMPGGRAVFLGLHDETSPLAANYLVRQEVNLIGSFAYTSGEFAQALALLRAGALRPSDEWLEERPLTAGPASFDELVAGRARATKIVLRVA
jgi:threonine dehydrogenase-like Zn-dependent dehydrogenase